MRVFRKFYVLISDCVSTGKVEEVAKTMFCTNDWSFTDNIEEASKFDSQMAAHLFLAHPPKNNKLYTDLIIRQASVEYNW